MAVATAIAIAGIALTAISSIRQGNAAKNEADFQSKVKQQQADRERKVSAQKEKDFRRQSSRQKAASRAARSASGVETGTGSSLLVEQDFEGQSELNALRIGQEGEVNATRLGNEASLLTSQGKSAQTGGFIRAGASILSGAGSFAGGFSKIAKGGAKTVISGGNQSLLPARRF